MYTYKYTLLWSTLYACVCVCMFVHMHACMYNCILVTHACMYIMCVCMHAHYMYVKCMCIVRMRVRMRARYFAGGLSFVTIYFHIANTYSQTACQLLYKEGQRTMSCIILNTFNNHVANTLILDYLVTDANTFHWSVVNACRFPEGCCWFSTALIFLLKTHDSLRTFCWWYRIFPR